MSKCGKLLARVWVKGGTVFLLLFLHTSDVHYSVKPLSSDVNMGLPGGGVKPTVLYTGCLRVISHGLRYLENKTYCGPGYEHLCSPATHPVVHPV
jgi:hypothetical protein